MLLTPEATKKTPIRAEAVPKYERLKQELLQAIAQGQLRVGEKLLPESELAQSHGIARSTVRQALGELESMGVVRRTPRRGTEIISAPASDEGSLIKTFGLVLPETESGQYISLQRSFLETLRSDSGQLVVCDSDQQVVLQLEAMVKLISSDVSGMLVVPVSQTRTPVYHFEMARRLNVPVVFCHRRVEGVVAPLVTFSGRDVGRKVGEVLREHGHRRVLFWLAHASTLGDFYGQGLRDAFGAVGGFELVEHTAKVYRCSDVTPQVVDKEIAELKQMMSSPNRPTAIFASCDSEADRIWSHLETLGYRVPNDISIISFGDSIRATPRQQQISSITISENEIGTIAFRILSELVSGQRTSDNAETIMVDCQVSLGQSIAEIKH